MRIVILGSPDTNKTGLALKLIQKFNITEIYPLGNPQDYSLLDSDALGDMADYRTELSLALLRQAEMQQYDDAVFTGTIFDNYAYALARVYRYAGSDATTEETLKTWARVAEMLAFIVRDSFRADKVVLITNPLQTDSFLIDLEDAMKATLDELGIKYITIDANFDPEQIVEEMWN